MRIPLRHVPGPWTTSFAQGVHTCVAPLTPGRGPGGPGRARIRDRPESGVEPPPERLRVADTDAVVLRSPHEPAVVDQWPGRRPPLVYLRHSAPHGDVPGTRHPAAHIGRAKDGDCPGAGLPGAALPEERGGQEVLLPRLEGRSSTGPLARATGGTAR